MSRYRVLAISPDIDRLRSLVPVLREAGADVDAIQSLAAVEGELIPHRYIFYAWDGELAGLEALLPRVRPNAHVACLVPKVGLSRTTELLRDARCNHVLVGEDSDRAAFVTAKKLLTGDIFGIEKYLPDGTEVHYLRLRDFKGRTESIDTILKFAEANGIRRQIRNAIGQVAEELLMNALYDAPVDEDGRQIFAEIDPHDRTETRSPRPVSIRYAVTETQFCLAVRDRFGRLAKDTILAYISKCLHSTTQIDRKTYGAGLGLYLVANAAASYVVNVAHGMATEVVCTFDRGPKVPLRLVGVFVHPGSAGNDSDEASGGSDPRPE